MKPILDGYRVLDFGRYIAGPYCASLLGFLGAEVIRIERPAGGEDRTITPVTETGDGAIFLQMNVNKLGMTLDIASPAGRKIIQQLVATADVVIANFPPNTLRKLGLDYDSLKAIKPDIILTTNTTFGSTGPYANKVGFDGIAQAMSGASYFSGTPGRPVKAAVQYVDFSTALAGAVGTLSAILHRERTGEGQQVETSLLATALAITNGGLIEQALIQANRVPSGNQAQVVAPSSVFSTKDGFILIQIIGPYMFKRWANLVGHPEWLEDPRFKDDQARGDEHEFLCRVAGKWCEQYTTQEALELLEANRIPAGAILTYQQALDHPYTQALNHLRPTPYPGTDSPAPIAQAPFQLSNSEPNPMQPAPTLSQHTNQILKSLGYTASEIAQLRANKII